MMKVLKQIEGGVNHFAFFFSLRTGDNSLASSSSNHQIDGTGQVRCPFRIAIADQGAEPSVTFSQQSERELPLNVKDMNTVALPPPCYDVVLHLPEFALAQHLFAAAPHRGRQLPTCRLTYTCPVLSPFLRALPDGSTQLPCEADRRSLEGVGGVAGKAEIG